MTGHATAIFTLAGRRMGASYSPRPTTPRPILEPTVSLAAIPSVTFDPASITQVTIRVVRLTRRSVPCSVKLKVEPTEEQPLEASSFVGGAFPTDILLTFPAGSTEQTYVLRFAAQPQPPNSDRGYRVSLYDPENCIIGEPTSQVGVALKNPGASDGWELDYAVPVDSVAHWTQWGGAGGGITWEDEDGYRMFGGNTPSNDAHRIMAWSNRLLPADGNWRLEYEYRRNETSASVGTASQLYVGQGTGSVITSDVLDTAGAVTSTPTQALLNGNINGGRLTYNTDYATDLTRLNQLRFHLLPADGDDGSSAQQFPFTPGQWFRVRIERLDGGLTVTVRDHLGAERTWGNEKSPAGRRWGFYQQAVRNANYRNIRIYRYVENSEPPPPPPPPPGDTMMPVDEQGNFFRSYAGITWNAAKVATPATIASILSGLVAGDDVIFENGNYPTITVPAVTGTSASKPIRFRARNRLVPTFGNGSKITVNCKWLALDGFKFTNGPGIKIDWKGTNGRIVGNEFVGQPWGDETQSIYGQAAYLLVEYNYWHDGGNGMFRWRSGVRPWIRFNRITRPHAPDYPNNPGVEHNETVQIGASSGSSLTSVRAVVEHNRWEGAGVNVDAELISNKSSDNVYYKNTAVKLAAPYNKSKRHQHRHGKRCRWIGGWYDGHDLRLNDWGQVAYSNRIGGGGNLVMNAGTIEVGENQAQPPGNMTRCVGHILADNRVASIRFGDRVFSGSTLGPKDTIFSANQRNRLLDGTEITSLAQLNVLTAGVNTRFNVNTSFALVTPSERPANAVGPGARPD